MGGGDDGRRLRGDKETRKDNMQNHPFHEGTSAACVGAFNLQGQHESARLRLIDSTAVLSHMLSHR